MSTASVQTIRLILAGWTARGGSVTDLLGAIGLEPQQLLDLDGRVPIALARRAWQVAAQRCGDPHFGLAVAELVQPLSFGALGYALYSSTTLGEAMRRFSTFFRLVHQEATLTLIEDADVARIRFQCEVDDPDTLRHQAECLLALLVERGRFNAGQNIPLLAVTFRHASPIGLDAHERAFGTIPCFSRPHNEIVIARSALALPLRSAAPTLVPVMERHLAQLLRDLPADETFLGRVRRVLAEELRSGAPTLSRTSIRLHLSARSLQRRLSEEGVAYHELLDELRSELARRYITERRESIAEIAFLLGFSEVSTFHRAFKRWTGLTPRAYREGGGGRASSPEEPMLPRQTT